ncbi:NRDE family protein [Leucobacter denitrificans]|uniref:NRDE family protein n=1 Tax=Leucobacter denitrificans TaxID=683042 RepID=A0A7G9S3H1_9MICO|nr:NRDE family protein [Leucobacter denitrificans]QNN62396.1 NRDE family protein [Leucobacter denitrificans]
MCTAIIEVPRDSSRATRMLAVRDEDRNRPWDPPGQWWPELPGVIGVRDRLANGAWLAASPGRGTLAVLLNRAPGGPTHGAGTHADELTLRFSHATPATSGLRSRGSIVLAAAQGLPVSDHPGTGAFNLVEVSGSTARVTTWDGARVTRTDLEPGVHMIAHHEVNDPTTARIARWLPEFRALEGLADESWRAKWIALLDRTTDLHPDDDRAIVRDNTVHGYPTQSLLMCTAEVRRGSGVSGAEVELDYRVLPEKLG